MDEKLQQLKDIKPLLQIQDSSLYWLIGYLFIGVLIVAILAYLWKVFVVKRKYDAKKEALKILKNLDFSDSKKAAYEITNYGNILVDKENQQHILDELNEMLLEYKYKKEVPLISNEVKQKLNVFLQATQHA
jgi:hypothetical protein